MPYCHKEVQMKKINGMLVVFTLFSCVFGFEESVSVNGGDSLPLNTGVNKQQRDMMRWYFNDILIAQINKDSNTSCLYDGEDGRFRGRVKVDYETGSLIITNIRSEHTGRYEAELIQSKSSGTSTSLNRNSKCDSTKNITKNGKKGDTVKRVTVTVIAANPGKGDSQMDTKEPETNKSSGLSTDHVAGIVVSVLVFVGGPAAGLYYCHKKNKDRMGREENAVV